MWMALGAVLPVVACLVSAPPAVDVHALRRDVVAVLDEWVDAYLVDQNLAPGSIRRGQFHDSDNMRLQECTALIAWVYATPDSRHHRSQAALDAAVASIDYMCRAQGSNGGLNEYHGWCGVPDRTPGKSSVAGFTLYGIALAIELLSPLDVMETILADEIDADGPAMPTMQRRSAWQRLLCLAMGNLYAGSGRGHSANQDLCALAAVYAVNRAWRSLSPSAPPLKSDAEVAAMRDEIFYGSPRDARNEYAGKWFSDMGLLFEGRPYAGYDANYAAVTLAYTGLCGDYDPEAARFGAKYWSALEYFFVPDVNSPLGISMEDGVSRRASREA
ncbi:hypothetical protein CMK11_21115, partial [Candidatus Poribacteria bacterium]|nr:hypothetical protein [Candidatus Poribacteria bacterium]